MNDAQMLLLIEIHAFYLGKHRGVSSKHKSDGEDEELDQRQRVVVGSREVHGSAFLNATIIPRVP